MAFPDLIHAHLTVAVPAALTAIAARPFETSRWSRAFAASWLFNLACMTGATFLVVLCEPMLDRIVGAVRAAAGGGLLTLTPPAHSGPARQALAVVEFAIAWDFFQYWAHRLQHAVPALWQLHRLHHRDEWVNATTSGRTHPLSHLFSFACISIPLAALFGEFSMPIVGTWVLADAWGCFNHLDRRIPLGRFTKLLSGPEFHRLHHSLAAEHRDANYAAFFPLLDVAFRTYREPRGAAVRAIGVAGSRPGWIEGGCRAALGGAFHSPSAHRWSW